MSAPAALAAAAAASGSGLAETPTKRTLSRTASRREQKEINVRVVIRCRPPNDAEQGDETVLTVRPVAKEVSVVERVSGKAVSRSFAFDNVFAAQSSQEEVYLDTVHPIVEEVLEGFNCTVFAYGQTGTGKTYTMEGKFSDDPGCATAGVIPRAVSAVFEHLKRVREYSVKVSFLELYNEELTDLMSEDERVLRLFEDQSGKQGVMVHNIEEQHVESAAEVFRIVQKCLEKRRTAATLMNEKSSRSHSIFTLTIHTKASNEIGEEVIKTGKLHLVDLAGSENVGRSGAIDKRAKEAGTINRSLLTLGRVINALVDKASYVPYRDSKLTRLLKESLGGCNKTCIIATVSPAALNLEETLSTLLYASRARSIKNKPEVNEKMTHKAYMNELLAQISALKREIEVQRTKNGIILPPERFDEMNAEIKTRRQQMEEMAMALEAKAREVEEVRVLLAKTAIELELTSEQKRRAEAQLAETVAALAETRATLEQTRITLAETQFLLDQHMRTERELFGQASELKSTLVSVVASKNALHDKIERKAGVEQRNLVAATSFRDRVAAQSAALATRAQAFAAQQTDALKQLEQQLLAADADKAAATEQLCASLASLERAVSASHQQVARQAEGFGAAIAQQCSDMEAGAKASHKDAATRLEALSQHVAAFAEGAHKLLAAQRKAQQQWQCVVRDATAAAKEAASCFAAEHADALAQIAATVSQGARAQQEAFAAERTALSAMASTQQAAGESLVETVVAALRDSLAAAMGAHSRQLLAAAAQRNAALAQQERAACQSADAVNGLIAAAAKQGSEWSGIHGAALDAVAARSGSCAQGADAACGEVVAAVEGFATQAQRALAQCEQASAAAAETAAAAARATQSDTSAFVRGELESLQAATAQCSEGIAAAQRASKTTAQLMGEAVVAASARAGGVCAVIGAFGAESEAACATLSDSAHAFVEKEMERDRRTGSTPEKKPIAFVQTLAKTDDHEALLARFRAAAAAEARPPAVEEVAIEAAGEAQAAAAAAPAPVPVLQAAEREPTISLVTRRGASGEAGVLESALDLASDAETDKEQHAANDVPPSPPAAKSPSLKKTLSSSSVASSASSNSSGGSGAVVASAAAPIAKKPRGLKPPTVLVAR